LHHNNCKVAYNHVVGALPDSLKSKIDNFDWSILFECMILLTTLHVGTQNSQNRNYAILYFALMFDSSKSKMNDFVDSSSLKEKSQDRNDVILDCLIPWNLKSLAFYSKCIEVLLIEIT
jgi:hypothetical protein